METTSPRPRRAPRPRPFLIWQARELFLNADKDNNGVLDVAEFAKLVRDLEGGGFYTQPLQTGGRPSRSPAGRVPHRVRDVRPQPSDVPSLDAVSRLVSSRRQQHSQISIAHAAFLHVCEQYQHLLHLEHFTFTLFPRTPHRLHFLCAR